MSALDCEKVATTVRPAAAPVDAIAAREQEFADHQLEAVAVVWQLLEVEHSVSVRHLVDATVPLPNGSPERAAALDESEQRREITPLYDNEPSASQCRLGFDDRQVDRQARRRLADWSLEHDRSHDFLSIETGGSGEVRNGIASLLELLRVRLRRVDQVDDNGGRSRRWLRSRDSSSDRREHLVAQIRQVRIVAVTLSDDGRE